MDKRIEKQAPGAVNGVAGKWTDVTLIDDSGYEELQTYFVPDAENTVLDNALAVFNAQNRPAAEEPFYFVPQEPNSQEAAAE